VFPEETLKEWLITLGFSLDKKKTNVYTVLKRMILHNVPTPKEVNMLETVLQQTIRKLKNKKD
jgi:tRNA/rRNA methyltransferase